MKQDMNSLQKYIREECDELLQAMKEDDQHHLCEEMGDVMFLLILMAEIADEKGSFSIKDVLSGVQAKMIRRHPHVFAGMTIDNEEELKALWKKIKLEEKAKKTN
jgi:tetrapyrrole methylase family protein/MazG family protein